MYHMDQTGPEETHVSNFHSDFDFENRHGDEWWTPEKKVEEPMLDKITTGKQPMPRRQMIYGPHGIGKSTFAAKAPKAIFIQTEDGLGDIDCAKFPLAKTLTDVQDSIRALFVQDHEYKTVVIDSLDWLERLVWADICAAAGKDDISDFGFNKGYSAALGKWTKILYSLAMLREQKGMATVLLAHTKIEKFEDPSGDSYDRYSPRLHKLVSGVVQEWCDEVLFATYRVFTKKAGEGFRERTVGVGTGERALYTTDRPAHIAKNRLGLPDQVPFEWPVQVAPVVEKTKKEKK